MQRQGLSVRIYSFSLQYPSFLFPGTTQYSDSPPPESLDIVTVVNSINPFNWWVVGRRLRAEAPGLVITRFWLPFMGPCLGTILRLARRGGRTRVVAITDNAIPHERRPGDRLFTRFFFGAVDGFVAMSHQVEADIHKLAPRKPVAYIPHPIFDNYGPPAGRAESLAHLGLPPAPGYLLFFGFIRAYKGLGLLLQAMADERIRALGLKLLVAGEFYEDEAPYRELISRNGLEGQVILRNEYIPNEEVRYYFGAANLAVQPYLSATQSGISQLAFHFDKPMVVTRVGGLPEIVRDGREGYVVEVSEQAIADAVVDFFQHVREQDMVAGVREGKKRFSWNNMVEGIKKLYDEL